MVRHKLAGDRKPKGSFLCLRNNTGAIFHFTAGKVERRLLHHASLTANSDIPAAIRHHCLTQGS